MSGNLQAAGSSFLHLSCYCNFGYLELEEVACPSAALKRPPAWAPRKKASTAQKDLTLA